MSLRYKLLLAALLLAFHSWAQNPLPVKRGSASVVAIDQNLEVSLTMKIPVVVDTSSSALYGRTDSMGLIIQVRSTGVMYIRDTVSGGHKWTAIGSGATGVTDSFAFASRGRLQKTIDSMVTVNNSRYRTPLDTSYAHFLMTRDWGYKMRDSMNAVNLTRFLLWADSVGTNAYTTFDRSRKISDSLGVILGNKVTNGGNVAIWQHVATYAGRPTVGIGLFYADDSAAFYSFNGAIAVNLTGFYNVLFRALGQPGDTSYVMGRGQNILVAAQRDSGDFHSVTNPDSSRTRYVFATGANGGRVMKDPVTGLLVTQPEVLHSSVRLATTAALAANTYNNGTAGVGATLTANSNGVIGAIDGVSPALNDRILVKNEAAMPNNGIYTVTQVGTVSTPYILTRGPYSSVAANMAAGSHMFVQTGTANINTVWYQQTAGTITFGTTNLIYGLQGGFVYNLGNANGYQVGTLGSRPSATGSHNFYVSTSDSTIYYDNGAWIPVGKGSASSGGGALTYAINSKLYADSATGLINHIKGSGVTFNQGDTLVWFGDSYGVSSGATTTSQGVAQLTAQGVGAILNNQSASGSTIEKRSPTNPLTGVNFIDRLTNLPHASAHVKYIIIEGGLNDIGVNSTNYNTTNFKTDLDSVLNYIINTKGFTPEQILVWSAPWIGAAGQASYAILSGNAAPTTARALTFITQAQTEAVSFGTGYFAPFFYQLHDTTEMAADGIHPNDAGHAFLAHYLNITDGQTKIFPTPFTQSASTIKANIQNLNLVLGDHALGPIATPMSINLGKSSYTALGGQSALKLYLYEDGIPGNNAGFAITPGHVEEHAFATGSIDNLLGNVLQTSVNPNTFKVFYNGSAAGTATATPCSINLTGSSNTTQGSNALKLFIYNDNINFAGIGSATNSQYYSVYVNGHHDFYIGGTLYATLLPHKLTIDSTGGASVDLNVSAAGLRIVPTGVTTTLMASTTAAATLNFPLGAKPTSMNQGDWGTASGHLYYHDGSTDYDLLAGGGFANPMTTLGDIIYGGASGAASRLAGNTTTTKQFYSSTGTGSAAQAPVLGALASGDIPNNAANTSGTASNLSGTPALPNGTTATTQTALDNSTKISTTAYTDAAVAAAAAGSAHTIYSATASGSTVSNSTSPESLMGSGTGSQTILANTLHAGSIIRMYAIVNYSTTSSTQGMTLSIVNTTNTVSSSAFTLPASSSNEKIIVEVTCKITAIGSSGSMTCVGTATVTSATGGTTTYSVAILAGLFANTINTTVNQTFDLTAAWSTANVSNSFTPLAMGYIESL